MQNEPPTHLPLRRSDSEHSMSYTQVGGRRLLVYRSQRWPAQGMNSRLGARRALPALGGASHPLLGSGMELRPLEQVVELPGDHCRRAHRPGVVPEHRQFQAHVLGKQTQGMTAHLLAQGLDE